MRRSSLGLVLIALNVSLALCALAGLAGAAAALLTRFTDEQALERVRVAAVSAERGIAGQGETVAAMARVLADRETPSALLAARRFGEAADDLERFRSTAGLTSCAAVRGGRAVASAGSAIDWPEIARGARAPAWSLAAATASALQL